MEYVPFIFSVLFLTVFAVYLFFGIHILRSDPKADLNRVFLALCISLCLWSLGFSVANSAPDIETCLLWRRISALGWASIYSVMLHFFLLLTNEGRPTRPWYTYGLLYLPAIIGIYVFSISNSITATQFNFVKMDYGWVNIGVQNGWTWFFNAYYIGYTLVGLGLLWQWKRESHSGNTRSQSNLIFYAVVAALILGSLTDVLLNSQLPNPLPQMAPVFTLLPMAAIYYSIRRYGLMEKEVGNKDELFLTNEVRSKTYYYLSIVFFAAGLLGLSSLILSNTVISEEGLKTTLYASGLFFIMGIAIYLSQFIRNEAIKISFIMIISLGSIPVITLAFLKYASITIWVFPILLMFATLVFNTRIPLVLITVTALITQVLVWIYAPSGPVLIDEIDFIIRIGIFIIAFSIAVFINNIYLESLRDNIYQTNYQKMISEVASGFVSINQANIDQKVDDLLKKIGQFFQVDRTYVFLINHREGTMSNTHEWCSESSDPAIQGLQNLPLDVFPWWMEQLRINKLVHIEDVNKLPDEAGAEKDLLTQQNIKSVMVIPIEEHGELLGFIGLDSVESFKKWSDYHIGLLRTMADLLADGLIKAKTEKEIEFMAYYDQLTGIPNRILFSDRLTQAINLAQRNERYIAIIFMDLDSFKAVNDTMGHNGGDAVIKSVAQSLVHALRKTDTVARFGGDEFLIMLNNLPDQKDVVTIAKNIMDLFQKPFIIEGQEFYITVSAGIAVYPVDGEDSETLIKNADIAMYTAKSKGKNQFALCTSEMKDDVMINIKLSNRLYRVEERNELLLYYQPQICLYTGRITGLEALLRWKHPELGMILPNVFIPLAERNGTINSIGDWVLKTAVSQNKRWQEMGLPHLRIGVNLSVIQLNNPDFADNVDRILKETGLKPEYLDLEITESAATREPNTTSDILHKLKGLGVSISIDDFGIEYSSLSRLKSLPIDRIKIDMQFVHGIEHSEKDQAITKVIINLAKNLGIGVLAEGVETVPQKEFLAQKMCDEVQGYFYYKPMPAVEIEELLRSIA